MKKLILLTFAFLFAANAFALTNAQKDIIRAMDDEMARTKTSLKMANLPGPYFVTYKVIDIQSFNFSANKGALTDTSNTAMVETQVSMRVGSFKEDNSFFDAQIFQTSDRQSASAGYEGIRAALWAETDTAYKNALNQLAKKQAFRKNKHIAEVYDDFSPAPAASDIQEITPQLVDKDFWQNLAKELSAQGDFKELESFTASIRISFRPEFFLSSEGARFTKDSYAVRIYLQANAKTQDRFPIEESRTLIYADFKDVPTKEELLKKAKEFALEVRAFTKAQKAQSFIGPVLLERGAAAALLAELFVPAAQNPRPVYSATSDNAYQGEFSQKTGLKIMPVFFDVFDDPSLTAFDNQRLTGAYVVDDEGVLGKRIQLVSAGKLVQLPMTRALIKGQTASNGHAVLGRGDLYAQAKLSNIIFQPLVTVPAADFKAKFLEYCAAEGLEYCYIIRTNAVANDFNAYRVNAKTGQEMPVYGATLKDLGARTLRDIKYAADDIAVYNRPNWQTIVAPSLILGEAEVEPTKKLPARKPLVTQP